MSGLQPVVKRQPPKYKGYKTFEVSSQAAMLRLTQALTGDIAIRLDEGKSYRLQGRNPESLTDWQEILAAGSGGGGGGLILQEGEADSNLLPGQAIYIKGSGHLDLANASVLGTAEVAGLVYAAALASTSAQYLPAGVLELSNWVAIAGTSTLAPGQLYYLATVDGRLTTTAPNTQGQFCAVVGQALSPYRLNISIEPFISL